MTIESWEIVSDKICPSSHSFMLECTNMGPKRHSFMNQERMQSFLWARTKEDFVIPWVSWDKVARPKEWGGWGIKYLSSFASSLAAKSGWRLKSMENLWTTIVKRKYIDLIPIYEWLR